MNTGTAPTQEIQDIARKLMELHVAGLRIGRIMSTEEVAAAANERSTANLVLAEKAWSVCGDVSSSMFRALQGSQGPAFRVTVFGSGRDVYLVLTHQVFSLQHRFVLPLYDRKVQELLAHAMNRPIWFSFSAGEQGFILRSYRHEHELRPVLAMTPKLDMRERDAAMNKLLDAMPELAHPARIPSCLRGHVVTAVSATLIAPEGLSIEQASDGGLVCYLEAQ